MADAQKNKVDKVANLVKPKTPTPTAPNGAELFMSIGGSSAMSPAPQVATEPQVQDEMPSLEEITAQEEMPSLAEVSGEVPSLDEVNNHRGVLDKLSEYYDILDIPAEKAKEGLGMMVEETANRLPWPEADSKSVFVNMLLNTPRMTADIAAEMTGEMLAPESVAMMGVGKGFSLIGKSKYGKEVLKPGIKTTIDYFSNKIPDAWKRPFVYKFGLPNKQEYLERSGERLRNVKEWTKKAVETGTKLHEGMSQEAQEYAHQLMTSGYGKGQLQMMAKTHAKLMKEKGITSPKKFIKDITMARDMVDEASTVFIEEARKTGFINDEVATIIEGNKGKYLPRLYEIFENKQLQKEISDGVTSFNDAMNLVEELPDFLKRVSKYSDDEVAAFMSLGDDKKTEILAKLGRANIKPPSSGRPTSAWFNFLRKRKDIPDDVRTAYKEIRTAAYPTAKAVSSIHQSIENLKFFDDIAKNPAWSVKTKGIGPKDWVKLPEEKKLGALAGHFVHPAIAEDLLSVYRIPSVADKMMNGYGTILRAWKASKILPSPATHTRNMVANSIMLDLSGVPMYRQPDLIYKTLKEMKKNGKYYKEAVAHDLIGTDYAGAELGAFLDDATRTLTPSKSVSQKLLHYPRKAMGGLAHIYAKEEEVFKVAKYIYGRQNGLKPKEAAYEAEKWLFNYGKISQATKILRDNPVYNTPFITYTAKSIPRIIESAVKNPFKLYKYHLFVDAANNAAAKKNGATPEEIAILKQKRGIGILAPTRDEDGKLMWFSLNNIFPWADLEALAKGRQEGELEIPRQIQPGGPAKILTDLMYNKNTYTGKEIAPEGSLQSRNLKRLGYLYQGMMPQLATPIPGAWRGGVQTAGPAAQRLADAAYADGVLPEPIAKEFLSKKEGYFGQSKHLPLAVIDVLFGMRAEVVDPRVLRAMDSVDFKKGLDEAVQNYVKFRTDKGVRTEQYQIDIVREQLRDRLDELRKQRDDSKEEISREALKIQNAKTPR